MIILEYRPLEGGHFKSFSKQRYYILWKYTLYLHKMYHNELSKWSQHFRLLSYRPLLNALVQISLTKPQTVAG